LFENIPPDMQRVPHFTIIKVKKITLMTILEYTVSQLRIYEKLRHKQIEGWAGDNAL
jgi:hypothetical protein